jgi:type IV secretory pathway VirB9-like protein
LEQKARLQEAMAPAPPAEEVKKRYDDWAKALAKHAEVEALSEGEKTITSKDKRVSVSTGYRWFQVGNKQIQALDQAHAVRLIERAIELGRYTREYIYGTTDTEA